MKRAFSQRPVFDTVSQSNEATACQDEQGSLGGGRKARTSAAMLGLAISMGASGVLVPRQDALATGLPSAALNPTLSTMPLGVDGAVVGMMPVATVGTAYHTVEEGQTLSQIAVAHRVNVQAVEQANGVSVDTVLQVGQVLRIPGNTADVEPTAAAESSIQEPPELAAARQQQVAFEQADAQLKVAQDDALQLTHEKRQDLQQALVAGGEQSIGDERSIAVSRSNTLEAAGLVAVESAEPDQTLLTSLAPAQENLSTENLSEPDLQASRSVDLLSTESWEDETVPSQVASDLADPENPSLVDGAVTNGAELTASSDVDRAVQPESSVPSSMSIEDGSETLQVLAPLEEPASSPWVEQEYQIQPGDTIADIATAYGVSTATLVESNQITNPDLIVAGDSLLIPSAAQAPISQQSEVDTVAVLDTVASPVEVGDYDSDQRLAYLQSTILNPIEDAATLRRLRQSVLPTGESDSFTQDVPTQDASTQAVDDNAITRDAVAGVDSTAATASDDVYMANLLAEVNAARQIEASPQEFSASNPQVTSPEVPLNLVVSPESSTPAINPEFTGREFPQIPESEIVQSEIIQSEATPVDVSAQLLAAAPLGSEVYAPINSPVAGQVVSPDMPALPDSDEFLPEAPNYFNGYVWPTTGTLTSGYGRRWGRMHRGIDVAGPVGTPIVAAAPGVVERAGWNSGGYGNLVDIRHADGSLTRYAHNSRLLVRPGQQVTQGQQIAEMGSTGYSTGPHLHFEIHLPNQGTVNPMAYLPGR